MPIHNLSYFLFRPRRISDLESIHPVEREKQFHIVQVVELSGIDYENFSEDLLADRAFLDSFS